MKKKILIISAIAVISLAIASMVYASITLKSKEVNEDEHLIEISFDELNKKVKNKETFILLISQTDCSHCLAYKPVLKRVLAKYDIYAYELALDKLEKEEKTELNNIANVSGTPNTVFIFDGEEKNTANRIVGEASETKIISRLKALGFIEEE